MTCTRPQAERQILLAMRASSTHGPKPAILHAHPVEVRAAFRRSSPLAQLINLRQLRNHLTSVVLVPSPKKGANPDGSQNRQTGRTSPCRNRVVCGGPQHIFQSAGQPLLSVGAAQDHFHFAAFGRIGKAGRKSILDGNSRSDSDRVPRNPIGGPPTRPNTPGPLLSSLEPEITHYAPAQLRGPTSRLPLQRVP